VRHFTTTVSSEPGTTALVGPWNQFQRPVPRKIEQHIRAGNSVEEATVVATRHDGNNAEGVRARGTIIKPTTASMTDRRLRDSAAVGSTTTSSSMTNRGSLPERRPRFASALSALRQRIIIMGSDISMQGHGGLSGHALVLSIIACLGIVTGLWYYNVFVR
jgi:hypothetical protein